jgi:hypothetical protein
VNDEQQQSIRAAVEAELTLLDPKVRSSPALISELLHPEFVEFGASGRRWDRTSILSAMAPGSGGPAAPITASDVTAVLLAPDIVHLTYVSDNSGRRAHRSSLWRWTAAGWLLYFHQGTPTDDGQRAG